MTGKTHHNGGEALDRFLEYTFIRAIDVGSGDGFHTNIMREKRRDVLSIDMEHPADHQSDYMKVSIFRPVDAIWCCHVLEHQPNVYAFLRKLRRDCRRGGILAITVPPLKHEIVGGHLSLWNPGLLLYNMIRAGFDCREARVGVYDYNVSVILRNRPAFLPHLKSSDGDIEALAKWFPIPVQQGFDGRLGNINW